MKTSTATEPIVLSHHERLAAIRAYNSQARTDMTRAQLVDHIIDSINRERCGDDYAVREMEQR